MARRAVALACAAALVAAAAAGEARAHEQCLHTVLTSNGTPYSACASARRPHVPDQTCIARADPSAAPPPPPPPVPPYRSAVNWQTRVMYASYLRAAARSDGLMRAFTRVLHRSTDDELVHEVPTWRVEPLHADCDDYCVYPVADRAAAVSSWLHTDDAATCSHLMLVETDYLYARPITTADLPTPGKGRGFKVRARLSARIMRRRTFVSTCALRLGPAIRACAH